LFETQIRLTIYRKKDRRLLYNNMTFLSISFNQILYDLGIYMSHKDIIQLMFQKITTNNTLK